MQSSGKHKFRHCSLSVLLDWGELAPDACISGTPGKMRTLPSAVNLRRVACFARRSKTRTVYDERAFPPVLAD